ncbi:MAG: hypothetical protein K9H61_06315 [Bacteroidia bacterium]|nr:hypothetical protein [Bacteroidia bacterium]MCF8425286.1 hypothetical protein [Bacteroidia bacterium]MCF8446592.1 hypothetical protein [Bacteroidia bacterium]
MLGISYFTLIIEGLEHTIYASPIGIHLKKQATIKSGKVEKLFFYSDLRDSKYQSLVDKNEIYSSVKFGKSILNIGQDFEEYYLGSFQLDYDEKKFWDWRGKSSNFGEKEVVILAEALFNQKTEFKKILIFTPTLPSQLNFKKGPIKY